MALIQDFNNLNYDIKCPYSMQPQGICIHNTYNDASARDEINYMKSNGNEVSFHIAIDDKESIQAIPFNRNTWHSGDGGNGVGNRNYISIEICYSKSGGDRFINAEKRAAKEVADLLKKYDWGIAHVRKHQDFSNKYCPHRTLDMGWNRFLDMIKAELNINVENPNIQTSSEIEIKRWQEKGKFTVIEETGIFFYNNPKAIKGTSAGYYEHEECVNYDLVVETNKYIYISWISASTGIRRYMPVREIINGIKQPLWGRIE